MYLLTVDSIRVCSITKITDQKLSAAHDGNRPRTAVRDLYDLEFISGKFAQVFTPALATRLAEFSADPEALISRYQQAYLEDKLIKNRVDLEALALQLHETANEILRSNTHG